jgi:arginine/lysine/ornithine decarboxylase
MPTPLLDQLNTLKGENPLWLDMPGHHGKDLLQLPLWTDLDRTEHTVTGDLFEGGDAIEAAEALWARRWGAEGCLFLTGGSTQGNHTALHLCAAGGTILADRGVHRSVWNSMGLLDLHPHFLGRPWDEERECTGPITLEEVERGWQQAPDAAAVILTSPTYYGVESPIRDIAAFCHQKGMRLVVDCAHGAHLPWIGQETPCQQGADLTVISAHKELPAPGQTALLLYNGFAPEEVRRCAAVYGSSSPSYWMMAALEGTLSYMEGEGGTRYRQLISQLIPQFQRELEETTRFRLVKNHDPARLVISTTGAGYTGFEAQRGLEERSIYVEMADLTHLVCITTCADGEDVFRRLLSALRELDEEGHEAPAKILLPPPPPLPQQVCSPRQAMFAPRRRKVLRDCAGAVSASQIAPYPPGVPVVAPGERIEKKHLAYLEKIGYNIEEYAEVLCETQGEGERGCR